MTSLEWLKSHKRRALVPEEYGPVEYALFHSSTEQVPGDAPPMPSSEDHVLLIAVRENRVAHYWIPETVMDDVEVDIWAEMWPSICEQLGIEDD